MKFTVTIREEKRGKHRVPVIAIGPLLTESGDGIRIQRNGKPDWKMPAVTTNELKKVVGAEQDNPLQADAKKAQKVEKAAAKAKKKDSKNFSKWVSDTEKAKSKSSKDMAEFYDSILELAHAYENAN